MGEANKRTPGRAAPDHSRQEIDYYEVDLREYLQILWRRKWIVLLCTVVALGVSALISFRTPDVYRTDVSLRIKRISIAGINTSSLLPSTNLVAEWAKDRALVTRAVATDDAGVTADWVLAHLSTNATKDFVELALEGPLDPETLARTLDALVEALQQKATAIIVEAIQNAIEDLDARREELLAKKSAWEAFLEEVRANAEAQRDELHAKIREIVGKSQGTSVDLEQSLVGYQLAKELDFLYERLTAVESLLDEIERLGVGALPGVAAGYGTLLGELADIGVRKQKAVALLENPPSPVTVVRGVDVPSAPVGPNRKMNLAVAGVLGIFLGILLAFSVHYLQTEPPSSGAAHGGHAEGAS